MNERIFRFIGIIAVTAFVISMMVCFSSCSGGRFVHKEEDKTDSLAKLEWEMTIEALQNDTASYRKQIREMEMLSVGIIQPACDTASIRSAVKDELSKSARPCDSARAKEISDNIVNAVKPKPATVKKNADGSLEITGNISSVVQTKTKEQEENVMWRRLFAESIKDHVSSMVHLVESHTTKEKKSWWKFLTGIWWVWMIIGAVAWETIRRRIPYFNPKPTNMKNVVLIIIAAAASMLLSSCGHYSDGTSVWAEGTLIVPMVPAIGAICFFIAAYRSSRSGSWKNPLYTGGKKEEGGNVPIWQHGFFWFSVICFLATVVIIWAINADK